IGKNAAGLTSATDWTWRGGVWAVVLALLAFVLSLAGFASVVVFLTKTSILVFVLIWVRGTLPRVRIDQLMGFAWKVLVPLGLLNFLVVTFQVATGVPAAWVLNGGFLAGVIALVAWGWKRQWAYSHASNMT
ncbi:MAG: NADH-quinone oxidoreductase subunit H, partial [Armatimonadota bacterium]|nr:NADH-quinone oxidoreductase subunit H [Armatimonadota bacterium]